MNIGPNWWPISEWVPHYHGTNTTNIRIDEAVPNCGWIRLRCSPHLLGESAITTDTSTDWPTIGGSDRWFALEAKP